MLELFSYINYWAVLVAAIVYWILGSLWFGVFFGDAWGRLLTSHGLKLKNPSKKEMVNKFIVTFILNYIVVLGVAFIIEGFKITGAGDAILLGIIIGVFIAAATMVTCFIWESRPTKLVLLDIGYPILGIIIASLIITLWP